MASEMEGELLSPMQHDESDELDHEEEEYDADNSTSVDGSASSGESSLDAGHEAPSSIPTVVTSDGGSSSPTLTTIPLAIIMFYTVSGGPFGVEESVRAGGAFYTLLFFVLMPFIWSLQESRIVAELSVAFPHSSGGVVWVEEAFGVYAGWLNGIMSWVSGATDNAIYPVLFLDYLVRVLPKSWGEQGDLHPFYRFILLAFVAICLGYMNWRGLKIVGNVSIVICAVAMSPFIFLTIFSLNKLEPSRWLEMPSLTVEEYVQSSGYELSGGFFPNATVGGILVRPFLNNLFWNFNSFDAVGCFSEEVGNQPEQVIPRALTITWVMTLFGYFIPIFFAIGASTGSQKDWTAGYLATIAQQVAGAWLGEWVVFAAGITNLALYQAELSGDVFKLYGMANKGLLPSALGKRSRHGTPTNAIIFATVIIIIFSTAHLDRLVEMLNFNYAFALLMEYAAFIKLRISKPEVPRPYRVPLGTLGCIIMLIPTVIATLFVMLVASYATMLVGLLSFTVSTTLYVLFEKRIRTQFSSDHAEISQLTGDIDLT